MTSKPTKISPSADVDERSVIGEGTTIWHLAQVREFATIGSDCIVGRGAYVDTGVKIGDRCKLQNYALIYAPAELGDGVFIGPGAVLTNDVHPRAVDAERRSKTATDWDAEGVVIGDGASIGAQGVVVAGVEVGPWALIGAGAVVTRDVAAHALCLGVPARQTGWVGFAGARLEQQDDETLRCPATGKLYILDAEGLKALP